MLAIAKKHAIRITAAGGEGGLLQLRKFTSDPNPQNKYTAKPKLFPYGWASWKNIREDSAFYADQTATIKLLDDYRYSYLWRPRRFGKTLLVNQLELYYDVAERHTILRNISKGLPSMTIPPPSKALC